MTESNYPQTTTNVTNTILIEIENVRVYKHLGN